MTKKDVTITTDGSARGNPGPGGWAALLETHKNDGTPITKLLTGEDLRNVTNNAMELMAVVKGLGALKEACRVILRIDSQYVINGIEHLLKGWNGRSEFNQELWDALAAALRAHDHDIHIEWVKGHSGDERNERVNKAALESANRALDSMQAANTKHMEWLVLICASSDKRRYVRWYARNDNQEMQGRIDITQTVTNPTAVWQGIVKAVQWLHDNAPHGRYASVLVQSNYEGIIKQGRGEWDVNKQEHKPFAAKLADLRKSFNDMHFESIKTSNIDTFFDEHPPQ